MTALAEAPTARMETRNLEAVPEMPDQALYDIHVTYAAGNTQSHRGLGTVQCERGANAFLNDLLILHGTGIKRLVVELHQPDGTPD